VRERVFWKNYFFHCAYTRYEAGLSIDEIWSELTEEERAPVIDTSSATAASGGGATAASAQHANLSPPTSIGSLMDAISAQVSAMNEAPATDTDVDETITFETTDVSGSVAHDAESTALFKQESASSSTVKAATKGPSESDFEMVGEDKLDTEVEDGADDAPLGDEDYELDELEAEIARELED
jgi:Pre-toxin domain with VENN motif